MGPVRFPFARRLDGSAVHVREYADEQVSCFGCAGRLIAKRGEAMAWHFAHHPADEKACSGETALHRMAKAVIARGHREARSAGRRYLLRWLCKACDTERAFDAAHYSHEAEVEADIVDGVRSDVGFRGEKPFAVEVVVTHDLPEATAALYEHAGVPVFLVDIEWPDVERLRDEIHVSECFGLKRCAGCAGTAEREGQLQQRFDALKAALKQESATSFDVAARAVRSFPPAHDPFGEQLSWKARSRLRELAIRLVSRGFIQQPDRWTFTRALSGAAGIIKISLADGSVPSWSKHPAVMDLELSVPLNRQEVFGDLLEWYLKRHVGIEIDDGWRYVVQLQLQAYRKSFDRKHPRRTLRSSSLRDGAEQRRTPLPALECGRSRA